MPISFEDIRRQAEKANITHLDKVQKLLHTAARTNNQTILKAVRQQIEIISSKKIEKPFPKPPALLDAQKSYITYGKTPDGRKVQQPLNQLTKHMLITGQSGAGKTDQIASIKRQLQLHDVSWWSFDLKKDYRHLADDDRVNLLVIPSSKLRINPLKPPPNVSPNLWGNQVAKVFADSNRLLDASRLYLSAKISQLYIDEEVHETGEFPAYRELVHKVEKDSSHPASKTGKYRDTVLNRLHGLTHPVFHDRHGYPLEDLLDRNVVFELKALDQNLQNFLMELFQAWIYMYRDSLPIEEREDSVQHILVYDEAYRMYDENKEKQTKSVPAVNVMTAQLRDFNEGIIAATQVPSQLTDFITANTNTKLVLPSVDKKQFDAVAESFNFDKHQEREAWDIEVGEAVVKYGSKGPFLISLPFFDLEKTVSDEDLLEMYGEEYRELLDSNTSDREEERVSSELSAEAIEILKDIAENPFVKTTERYEKLDAVSTGKAHEYKAELVDNQLIRPEHVAEGNSVFKLFEVTEKGEQIVEKYGGEVNREGRGGLKHRFYQHRIKQRLEEEAEDIELEKMDADVYVEFGERVEAYEVAMSSDDREVEHVKKHFSNGVDRVTVCCSNKKVLEQLEGKMPDRDDLVLTRISEVI